MGLSLWAPVPPAGDTMGYATSGGPQVTRDPKTFATPWEPSPMSPPCCLAEPQSLGCPVPPMSPCVTTAPCVLGSLQPPRCPPVTVSTQQCQLEAQQPVEVGVVVPGGFVQQ